MTEPPLIALAVAAVWAAFGSAMPVIHRLNETRDRVLDWSAAGTKLTADQRDFLLRWDYVPIWVSVLVFIFIFTLAMILFTWSAFAGGLIGVGSVCTSGVLFGVLGIVLQIWIGKKSIKMMSDHISKLRSPNQDAGEDNRDRKSN